MVTMYSSSCQTMRKWPITSYVIAPPICPTSPITFCRRYILQSQNWHRKAWHCLLWHGSSTPWHLMGHWPTPRRGDLCLLTLSHLWSWCCHHPFSSNPFTCPATSSKGRAKEIATIWLWWWHWLLFRQHGRYNHWWPHWQGLCSHPVHSPPLWWLIWIRRSPQPRARPESPAASSLG